MRKKLIIAIIILIIISVLAYGIYYVSDYYHADAKVVSLTASDDTVKITNTSNGLLIDGYGNDTALIFYPGAKVEYTSYLPLFREVSARGVDCYLVEMPFNLAFFGQNSADEIINSAQYNHYVIAGHSLGGVMASSYVNSTNNTDGVILLASYPANQIQKPVLSIYGTEDKVLNIEKYDESKPLMDNLTEYVIDGANHAQFGNYGKQSGDGNPLISADSQQNQTVSKIIEFIDECESNVT